MVLEGEAFVEFGERDREADFRHGEDVVVFQDEDAPTVLGPDVNGRADPSLLEHDVTLDRGRRLVLAGLDDAVFGGGAGAQHLEEDHGIMNDLGGWIDGRAHDHSVRVTNVIVSDADLEIASVKAAGLAPEPSTNSYR